MDAEAGCYGAARSFAQESDVPNRDAPPPTPPSAMWPDRITASELGADELRLKPCFRPQGKLEAPHRRVLRRRRQEQVVADPQLRGDPGQRPAASDTNKRQVYPQRRAHSASPRKEFSLLEAARQRSASRSAAASPQRGLGLTPERHVDTLWWMSTSPGCAPKLEDDPAQPRRLISTARGHGLSVPAQSWNPLVAKEALKFDPRLPAVRSRAGHPAGW